MGLLSGLKSLFGGTDDTAQKYTAIINSKEGKIVELERQVEELRSKDEQLVLLQKELARLKETTSKGDATIKAKEDRIAGLERTVSNLRDKLDAAKSAQQAEPKPEPKPEAKPQKPAPAAVEKPIPIPDSSQLKSKSETDDPYQQIGQDLLEALRKTTKRGED